MSLNEVSLRIPTEHMANVFGQFDANIKKIERTLGVTVVVRDDQLKIIGTSSAASGAQEVFEQLYELAKRGNVISEQNVNYALALLQEHKGSEMVEMDKDVICHTIQGKPVKPKTLGQKDYVDNIRKKMIVFGMGPAGTGKTYLAMAMAITAFKNEEVGRIILTRPAIEAGEKLGFLPGDHGNPFFCQIISCCASDDSTTDNYYFRIILHLPRPPLPLPQTRASRSDASVPGMLLVPVLPGIRSVLLPRFL